MREFVGNDWTPEECELALLSYIDMEHHKVESELFVSKFWDYKMLHPIQATLLFAEHYKAALKMAIRKRHDYYAGKNFKGLKHHNLLECGPRVITGMHKARQMADKLGTPYDFYCYRAMDFAMRVKMHTLPNPTALYSLVPKGYEQLSIVEDIALSWDRFKQQQIHISRENFYKIENFCSNRYQIEHQRYLMGWIRRSRAKVEMITKYVIEEQLAFPELVAKEFGESLLQKAKSFA